MGDFERTFGAGADVVSIINRYSRDYYASDEDKALPPPEPYRHWFPDYASAEAWEGENKGVRFKRQRMMGGFEIETFEIERDQDNPWRPRCSTHPVEIAPAMGLDLTSVRHGQMTMSLAESTGTALVQLLDDLRHFLPKGRMDRYPIKISSKEFYAFFRRRPTYFSHDLGLGRGAMAIFACDHFALIGSRHSKGEIRLQPWIMAVECAGGPGGQYIGAHCFLCGQHEIEVVRENSHLDYEIYSDHPQPGHEFYHRKTGYAEGARENLASCILDWIETLTPFNSELGSQKCPPSCVKLVPDATDDELRDMQGTCEAIACALAAKSGFLSSAEVAVVLDQGSWSQTGTPAYRLTFKTNSPSSAAKAMPRYDLRDSQVSPELLGGLWSSTIGVISRDGAREGEDLIVASGSFSCVDLSSHERMAALGLLEKVEAMDLPQGVREALVEAVVSSRS